MTTTFLERSVKKSPVLKKLSALVLLFALIFLCIVIIRCILAKESKFVDSVAGQIRQ